MPLLLDEDYEALRRQTIEFIEAPDGGRQFVFKNIALPSGVYNAAAVDVLVEIPANYNSDGPDMFWTSTRLTLADGSIPKNTCGLDGGDNRRVNGAVYCRWSRHWNKPQNKWRSGVDDISSIYRRIMWAFENPNPPDL